MRDCYSDEFHIEDVQEIAFVFFDFYLLDEGLEEYFDRNAAVFADDVGKVAEHEFSHV